MIKMRILVSGGAGFTGTHLATRLAKKGHEVRIIDLEEALPADKVKYFTRLGVEVFPGDVKDKYSVKKAVKEVEMVYHLATPFRKIAIANRVFWDTDVKGTQNLLDASIEQDVSRFIHCSTVGVHGHISDPPADESYPYNPGDMYQKTKCEGEKLVLSYLEEEKPPGVIVRPCGIYGPGDTRLFKLFKLIHDQKFLMIGDGEVSYHLVYIDDLIDAFELCGQKEEALGEVYIIGEEESHPLNEIVKAIAEALNMPPPKRHFPFIWPVWLAGWACEAVCKPFGVEPPLFRRRVDFFRKNRAFDISKAKRELGYEPKFDFVTGIKTTADWYRKEGWL